MCDIASIIKSEILNAWFALNASALRSHLTCEQQSARNLNYVSAWAQLEWPELMVDGWQSVREIPSLINNLLSLHFTTDLYFIRKLMSDLKDSIIRCNI